MKNTELSHSSFLVDTLSALCPITTSLKAYLLSLPTLEYQPGETILLKGKAPVSAFFLSEGAAQTIHYDLVTRERIPVWLWCRGDFITAFDCFLSQDRTGQSMEIIAPAVVIEMPYEQLHELFARFPETMQLMLLIQERFIRRIDEHRVDVLTLSAREIKDKYERERPELFQLFKLKDIARFLRMTRETLSRLRK